MWGYMKRLQMKRQQAELKRAQMQAASLQEKAEFSRELEKSLQAERQARVQLEKVDRMKQDLRKQRTAKIREYVGKYKELSKRAKISSFGKQGSSIFEPRQSSESMSPFSNEGERVRMPKVKKQLY